MTQDTNPDMEAVGRRIRMLRELADMTQEAFAREVNRSQPAVSQWEKGRKMPDANTQFRVADVLRVSRSNLFAELVGKS